LGFLLPEFDAAAVANVVADALVILRVDWWVVAVVMR